ncbi:response regulator transcription factor [Methylotenera versatilis]|jgi:two-component system, OmpR family, response regulator RegX3|uniref:Two component transcriptional regulator, winged helix family n=1 Tax=Methylotenera versatilis (strain 301) TaxID=666681 RepID=D7DIP6_METV0|nr:response regulator transcription factor [Methylotenera versatilis]ADI29931.1 two component transcriptional regulator, winged helix family [Methylotenera versatilis 301]
MVEANKKPKVAFLEDDLAYAETILEWFNEAGFEVDHFVTGLDFLRKFSNSQYDLCLFDWSLPDMEGPDVMVSIKLRSNKLPPIIFLTGRSSEDDIVRVIESGADDYMVKPASRQLIMARVNALLRRTQPEYKNETVFDLGGLKIDTKQRLVLLDGEEIKLTDKELDLAWYFLKNVGVLLSRAHLMQVVWGSSADIETRKVDVHVSHLRTKLKLTPEYGWRLTSIYQQGYRLERAE